VPNSRRSDVDRRIIRRGNASVREACGISRGSFRVSPLCVYKQAVSAFLHLRSLHFSSHSLLICPPALLLIVLSSSRCSPPIFFSSLFLSLSSYFLFLCSRPRLFVERKKAAVSHVVSPHYHPLPSRPLRFKSPCDGGGREDVNFYMAWERERDGDAQPRNEAPYRRSSFKDLSKRLSLSTKRLLLSPILFAINSAFLH